MAHLDIQARYDAHNPPALRELVTTGAQLMPFPQSVLTAAHKAALALYASLNEKNPRWRKIHASYAHFLKDQAWGWGYTEAAYASYMHRHALEQARLDKLAKQQSRR